MYRRCNCKKESNKDNCCIGMSWCRSNVYQMQTMLVPELFVDWTTLLYILFVAKLIPIKPLNSTRKFLQLNSKPLPTWIMVVSTVPRNWPETESENKRKNSNRSHPILTCYQNDLNPIHVHPDVRVQILAPSIGRTVLEPPWLGPGPGCSQIHVAKTVVLPRLANPDGAGLSGRVCLYAAGTVETIVVSNAISGCFAHFSVSPAKVFQAAHPWGTIFCQIWMRKGILIEKWGDKLVERQRHLVGMKRKSHLGHARTGRINPDCKKNHFEVN